MSFAHQLEGIICLLRREFAQAKVVDNEQTGMQVGAHAAFPIPPARPPAKWANMRLARTYRT